MSRIGKEPIALPNGVKVNKNGQYVTVTGPRGNLTEHLPQVIDVLIYDQQIQVQPINYTKPSDVSKEDRSMWGLARSLVNNMVIGVSSGFTRVLEIHGIGYKAAVIKQGVHTMLQLIVGYSHDIFIEIPSGVEVSCEKNTIITLNSNDKKLLGELAAQIKRHRPPNAYKGGKGIRYQGEQPRIKAGKKK